MTRQSAIAEARSYFDRVYRRHPHRPGSEQAAHHYDENPLWQHYEQALRRWVVDHGLHRGRVLEVGCGLGLLQDLVPNYIGIDIASTSGAYTHKPFSAASAAALPFADNSFDGIWSIWVLEHVSQPEQMLAEIERVLKPGGVLFLCAAWEVPAWVAKGYDVRPFRGLTWRERLVKLTVIPRTKRPYRQVAMLLRRTWRLWAAARAGYPVPLYYRRLTPNYTTYWSSDADACTAVDSQAVWLWFTSRGHQSLDSRSRLGSLLLRHSEPLRFRKMAR
jgi:SAM-dependent methyltransferase